jgi:mevalonate kinase
MPELKQTYHAHGKLLLTGEYFVLKGAKAIALPLQYGQRMEVLPGKQEQVLSWKAFMQEGLWFSCDFQLPGLKIIHSSDSEKAVVLQETLKAIQQMKPDFQFNGGLDIQTKIDFDNQWGLGSSSTLIANLAAWAGVDAFELNERIFNGSGFDIACASASGPIFYQKNGQTVDIELDYPFLGHLYFIYSGSKKSTRNEVRRFLKEAAITSEKIRQINSISTQIAKTKTLAEFQHLIHEHEHLVSELLKMPPVKQAYFGDFEGEMKSLGAWGGDFYLAATPRDSRYVLEYFKAKGLQVVFPWKELVLNNR